MSLQAFLHTLRSGLGLARFSGVLRSRVVSPPSLAIRERSVIENRLRTLGYLPESEPLSDRYLNLLRETAKELGLSVAPGNLGPIADQVEKYRQRVAEAALSQIQTIRSGTFNKLNDINKAERKWLEFAAGRIGPLITEIFDRQCLPARPQNKYLAILRAKHPASTRHFERIRTDVLPAISPAFAPESVPDYNRFASSVPWFPSKPAFNGLLPEDMIAEELDYLRRRYPADHPILRPYTLVERLAGEKSKQERAGVKWVVDGLQGRKYRVTNICFHDKFKPLFAAIAQELRASAEIKAGEEELHPQFRKYLLTLAEAIEEGDFTKWLKADLEQQGGNIFFTLFPHEGYWPDNLKFPFTFEIGIRDQEFTQQIAQDLDIARESIEIIWTYGEAGFMSALPHGAAGGHDSPKVNYPGISRHRTVIILDAVLGGYAVRQNLLKLLFKPEAAASCTEKSALYDVAWHEVQHGKLGNRPDTVMQNGKTMGETYGAFWGAVAEPDADLGALTATMVLHQQGRLTDEELKGILVYSLFRALLGLRPKASALNKEFIKDASHLAGALLYLGYLFSRKGNEIVRFGNDNKVEINFRELMSAVEELNKKFIEFGQRGNLEEFLVFYNQCVNTIPDEFIQRVRTIVGPQTRPLLLQRPGDSITGK